MKDAWALSSRQSEKSLEAVVRLFSSGPYSTPRVKELPRGTAADTAAWRTPSPLSVSVGTSTEYAVSGASETVTVQSAPSAE